MFSSPGSGGVENGISGEPKRGARRFASFCRESPAGGGTEVVSIEDASMVGAIVRAEGSSRVSTAAVGSGEVAESWKVSVAV